VVSEPSPTADIAADFLLYLIPGRLQHPPLSRLLSVPIVFLGDLHKSQWA
jgi:hypothetical protein